MRGHCDSSAQVAPQLDSLGVMTAPPVSEQSRQPLEPALREFKGWLPVDRHIHLSAEPVSLEVAKSLCETRTGNSLNWTESSHRTPEGHRALEVQIPGNPVQSFRLYPQYFPPRLVPIQGAKFVSQDATCLVYTHSTYPNLWGIYAQIDETSGKQPTAQWFREAFDPPGTYGAILRTCLLAVEKNEVDAARVGQYFWSLSLLASAKQPDWHSWLKAQIRRIAAALLLHR